MKSPQSVTDKRVQHKSSAPFFSGGKSGSSFFPPVIQAKLNINTPNDPYEREADAMADRVMSMDKAAPVAAATPPVIQRKCANCEEEEKLMRKETRDGTPVATEALAAGLSSSKGSGSPLPENTRSGMEQAFNTDFSKVRVHTGGQAAQMSGNIQAKAFTHGNDIYFNQGQYAPESSTGKHLLAHELTHTVQQNGSAPPAIQRYTDEERRRMAEFRETGQANDLAMATQRGFVPGDIVFRSGSTSLGILMGEPVTHGGIYIGNGLIHDAVGFGNRFVRVSNFFNPAQHEAADANIFRIIRFIGPLSAAIIARLLSNIGRHDFRMPTDPVPFNLFSSSDDYRTATCLEYAHAQFLYAIRQLAIDPTTAPADVTVLRATYFTGTNAQPNNLIRPTQQHLMGYMPDTSAMMNNGGMSGMGGMLGGTPRTPTALLTEGALIAAASAMATDIDPTRFANRSESRFEVVNPANSFMSFLMGPLYDMVTLNTFTYQSFVNSRAFFQDVQPAAAPAAPATH